ncbi:hypothetical protein RFI_06135 [Reticulomyxa filosa]|uniref:Uncharacterized protein n=1 Tax=Reticulomyxa filosa TaxID=46433 RepID=X6P0D6_RETFI|nr:hypothetical protein RFI_06135 [Reticulomyxa filosa]|eukprot:ETO30987.1 hypothetical protein RFI_06135 [Reticulomyxa filosa]
MFVTRCEVVNTSNSNCSTRIFLKRKTETSKQKKVLTSLSNFLFIQTTKIQTHQKHIDKKILKKKITKERINEWKQKKKTNKNK